MFESSKGNEHDYDRLTKGSEFFTVFTGKIYTEFFIGTFFISLFDTVEKVRRSYDLRMPSVRYSMTRNTIWPGLNLHFTCVFRLLSPVGILRAVWIGGKSHPRDFGASLYDGLPNDYSRDTAAHGENTVDKWVFLIKDNRLERISGNTVVEHTNLILLEIMTKIVVSNNR